MAIVCFAILQLQKLQQQHTRSKVRVATQHDNSSCCQYISCHEEQGLWVLKALTTGWLCAVLSSSSGSILAVLLSVFRESARAKHRNMGCGLIDCFALPH